MTDPVTSPAVTSPAASAIDPHAISRRTLSLGLAAAVVLGPKAALAAGPDYPPTKGEMQGFVLLKTPAPAPQTPFFDGAGNVRHFSDFRGRVLVVNFWATWCAPCIKEMPSLSRLQERLGGPDFHLLAISQDRGGHDVAEPFIRDRLGLENLDLYYDPKLRLGRDMGVRGLPSTYVIDRAGNLVGGLAGAAEWDSEDAVALVGHVMRTNRKTDPAISSDNT